MKSYDKNIMNYRLHSFHVYFNDRCIQYMRYETGMEIH